MDGRVTDSSRVRWRERALIGLAAAVTVASSGLLVAGYVGPTTLATATGSDGGTAAVLAPSEAVLSDVDAYRTPRNGVVAAAAILAVLVPVVVAVGVSVVDGPTGRRSGRLLTRLRRSRPFVAVAAVVGVTVLASAVVRLPLGVWAGVVQDGAWGFRTATVGRWFADRALLVGGEVVLVALAAAVVTLLVRRSPEGWPARLVLGVALVGPLLLLLHPVVVHGLLLPTGPLPPGPHRDAIVQVMERSEVDVPVLVGRASLRTTRPNAVATGLGPTARVVVYDTALALPPSHTAAIVAHELAHVERRDPLRAAVAPVPFVALAALLGRRWLRGPVPVRRLALAAVVVIAVEAAAAPVVAALTRASELRTDVRAVALSGDPVAHVALLQDLVVERLTDPEPPRWFALVVATHPSPAERARAVGGSFSPGAPASATR